MTFFEYNKNIVKISQPISEIERQKDARKYQRTGGTDNRTGSSGTFARADRHRQRFVERNFGKGVPGSLPQRIRRKSFLCDAGFCQSLQTVRSARRTVHSRRSGGRIFETSGRDCKGSGRRIARQKVRKIELAAVTAVINRFIGVRSRAPFFAPRPKSE